MRGERFALLCLAAVAGLLAGAPVAGASKPGDTEHGVNRDRLAQKAQQVIEERNGIEVLKISRCGPKKRNGRPVYSKWVCEWRAEGVWPGEVPYHCAGRAVYKRKRGRWNVEPCRNRMQPMAPLLDVPNPPPVFGYNDNWIFHGNQAFDLLDASGARVARTSLAWWGVEGNRGSYDWYGSDQMYERLRARGLQPLWVIVEAPCWAQPDPGACANGRNQLRPSPQYYDEMAEFAVAAAKRYPDSVGIEVWNEPNYPRFWGGWPEPDQYAKMLKTVAGAVHARAPGMPVVSAGLSPHADSDKHAIGFSNFLDKLYKLGAAQQADAIGIHPYPGVGPAQDYIGDVRVYLGKIQRVLGRNGDSQTPLWATEFGVSTTGPRAFEAGHQGRALTELYELLRRVHKVELAIVHRFVEDPRLPGREGGFGVLGQNLSPKPAYCDLARARGVSAASNAC
jgi:polysaccharide biosynthesis protein PslG